MIGVVYTCEKCKFTIKNIKSRKNTLSWGEGDVVHQLGGGIYPLGERCKNITARLYYLKANLIDFFLSLDSSEQIVNVN